MRREDLVHARLSHGFSQESLAAAAAVSRDTIRRAEAGESIGPNTARKIGEHIGMTPGQVLGLVAPEERAA